VTVSPFDHPILSGLLGDEEVSAYFSAQAELDAMLEFEIALAQAEAEAGVIPAEAGAGIAERLSQFLPNINALRRGVAQDGVVIPELVKQLRRAVGEPWSAHVHYGATSQDVIDTGLAIRLRDVLAVLDARLEAVIVKLDALADRDGGIETMAHTRMQAAIPVPAARKIASWRDPLARHRERLAHVRREVCCVTFGGAAGTLEKLGEHGSIVTERIAQILSLNPVARARHSERDGVGELASWLSLVSGSIGKMGQDIALLAQSEVGEIKLAGGGGSSAMPHKVNPVGAEILVTLARFNASLLSGVHQSLVHENERSGAAWTLEWMLLPQMIVASACALRTANELLGSVSFVATRSR
jgi:3-carboxy-cis,cis-muconate cycloisomerase